MSLSAAAAAKGRTTVWSNPPKGVPPKLGDKPLRLIIVGHNPSAHAWQTGHYYSNPNNKMWPILIKTGIAPAGARGAQADDSMPAAVGVGFTDVGGGHPGTDSSKFTSASFAEWAPVFYERLRSHMATASAAIGCTCGTCGAPSLVAFGGKRQFLELLNLGQAAGEVPASSTTPGQGLQVQTCPDAGVAAGPAIGSPQPGGAAVGGARSGKRRRAGQGQGAQRSKVATVLFGVQSLRPPGWPLPASTEVWVCSSTSGLAAMTNTEREAPYAQLAQRLQGIPWPRPTLLLCKGQQEAQQQ